MIENYNDFIKFLSTLTYKPTLLLHSCCAPCSSYTIELLKEYFDVTIFYSNDNIYPYNEFVIRSEEQIHFANEVHNLKVIVDDYDDSNYKQVVKGLENLGEGSKRCYECYKMRMLRTCEYAKNNNFEYFTTTLSISPYKNSNYINEIGYNLEKEYGVKYLYSNFKKKEGYKKSIELSRKFDLYRQDYCGCIYSLAERRNHE